MFFPQTLWLNDTTGNCFSFGSLGRGHPSSVIANYLYRRDGAVLLTQSAIIKYHRLSGSNVSYFSHFWRQKVQDQGASMAESWFTDSHLLLIVLIGGERGQLFLPSYKDISPTTGALPSSLDPVLEKKHCNKICHEIK
jgi:hypothetical protein